MISDYVNKLIKLDWDCHINCSYNFKNKKGLYLLKISTSSVLCLNFKQKGKLFFTCLS